VLLAHNTAPVVLSPEYYDWALCSCSIGDEGTKGVCDVCPFGADCSDGNQMKVLPGFWCDLDRHRHCELCEADYCCPGPDPCALTKQCAGNRGGVLCGECLPNHSVAMGAVGCVNESNGCEGAKWILPLVVMGTGVFVGIVVVTFRPLVRQAGSLRRSLLDSRPLIVFFYQIAPLVSSGVEPPDTAGVLTHITNIFNLDFDASNGATGGVCFAPGLNSVSKRALAYGVPLLMLGWTVVVLLFLRVRASGGGHGATETTMGVVMCRQQGIIRAVLTSLSLGYSTLLRTTFTLLHCIPLEGRGTRLLVSGGVTCYTVWQRCLFVVVVVLALYPLAFAFWLHRQMRLPCFRGSAAERLVASFREGRELWPAAVFGERLVLVLLYTFGGGGRDWAMFFCVWLLVPLHLVFKPYRDPRLRGLDLFFLGLLITLSAMSTSGTLYARRFHTRTQTRRRHTDTQRQ